uniref:BZIP domain-containing protein n=1 Tax=Prasinoderma singulare TaxID=676789 RepID=A0A7S3F7N8_9VIRI
MVAAAQQAAQREAIKYVQAQQTASAAGASGGVQPVQPGRGRGGKAHAAGTKKSKAAAARRANSGSNSGEEDDDPALREKRERRMLSNRESARRSRQRKQVHLDELNAHVTEMQRQNIQLQQKVQVIGQHMHVLQAENKTLAHEKEQLLIVLRKVSKASNKVANGEADAIAL